jgi:subtilase family serine protease
MTLLRHVRRPATTVAAVGSVLALTALGAGGFAPPAAAATPSSYRDTPLQMVPAMLPGLNHATYLGAAPAGRVLTFGVAVTGADPQGESQLQAAQDNPSSPYYHQWLTPTEFSAEFGVPADREDAIVSWLQAGGAKVLPATGSGTYIEASATVADLQSLFKVTEGSYTVGTGAGAISFVANMDPPQVPSGFQIAAVSGLDTLRQFRPSDLTSTPLTAADRAALATRAHDEATGVPDVNAPIVATATLQPRDLWSIYDQPSTDLGQGETSGMFGEGESDSAITQLRLFETSEGFPKVPVRVVRTEGDSTDDAAYGDNTGSIEWYLDVQALTGMAPDLSQLDMYFSKTLYDPDVFQSFSYWANDPNGPTQMNASFGECETDPGNAVFGPLSQQPYGSELGDELEPVGEPILEQATMEGRTLFASAGDDGSGCPAVVVPVLGAANGVAPQALPIVNYPAASDYAVGVGGTVLTFTGSGDSGPTPATRTEEGSWTDTGGGASHFLAEPAFQDGVSAVDLPCATTPSGSLYANPDQICRGVPDVAALSGNITGNGYFIYIDGSPSAEGGTSLSSPLTVGMWTRIQAASNKVSSSGVHGLGFAAPVLYGQYDYQTNGENGSYGRDFFDVTQEEDGVSNGAYMPGPGWDYTSGLGVMNVGGLLKDLDGTETPVASEASPEAPATAACTATETSPVGNATDAADVQLGNDAGLDLTRAVFATTPEDVTVTITGPDFVENDPLSPGGQEFKAYWSYAGHTYDIDAVDRDGTFTVTDGTTDGGTPAAGTPAPTATLSNANATLTLTAPLADVGSPVSGAQLLYPAVDAISDQGAGGTTALSFSTDTASAYTFSSASVGQAVQLGKCTTEVLPATVPTAALPESPEAAALPLIGAGVVAAFVAVPILRRRRRAARG